MGSDPHQIKYVAVLTDQRTIWFLCHSFTKKASQPVVHIVGHPGAAELEMGLKPPDCQLSDVQLFLSKEKEQVGRSPVPENCHIIQPFSFWKDPFLLQCLIDPVYPFLQVPAASLEDQSLTVMHLPEFLFFDLFHHDLLLFSLICPCQHDSRNL